MWGSSYNFLRTLTIIYTNLGLEKTTLDWYKSLIDERLLRGGQTWNLDLQKNKRN
jgi:hypothetical protein